MRDPSDLDGWKARLDAVGVDVPVPFDMDQFCMQLAEQRDRDLDLVPAALGGELTGLWIATGTRDIVYYEQAATPLHQQHIQLHEIGHMLCGHPHGVSERDLGLIRHLDLGRLSVLMTRSHHRDAAEREAESFAQAIGTLALRPAPFKPGAPPPQAQALARAEQVFGSWP